MNRDGYSLRTSVRIALAIALSVATLTGLRAEARPQSLPYAHGLLWKIEDPENPASYGYLFGTIHVNDPRVLDLPQPVRDALNDASSFSMEIKPDEASVIGMLRSLYYTTSRKNLRMVAGEKLFQKARYYLSRAGYPDQQILRMKPWGAMMLLGTGPAREDPGSESRGSNRPTLDTFLFLAARSQGKPTYSLETLREHLKPFESLSEEDQVLLLKNAIKHMGTGGTLEETILQYLTRDLTPFMEEESFDPRYTSEQEQDLINRLNYNMLDHRNHVMVEAMIPRIEEGGGFSAVGAAHLPGENGMCRILEERGYVLTRLY